MAIVTVLWTPDTCGCELEETYDDSTPLETRTYNLGRMIKICPGHQSLTGDITKYDTVATENKRKNITLQTALDNGPAALYDLTPEGARVLKKTIVYNFNWTGTAPDRVLNITFTGITLTTQQRNAIQTFLDNKFGIGKVVIA